MNCFNEDLIQRYIDNEISESEKNFIEKHIKECDTCASKLEEQTSLSSFVKGEINSIYTDNKAIPKINIEQNEGKIIKLKDFIITLSVACSIVIGLFFFTRNNENEINNASIVQSIEFDIDANKTITEQDMIITVVGPDGEVSEILIN